MLSASNWCSHYEAQEWEEERKCRKWGKRRHCNSTTVDSVAAKCTGFMRDAAFVLVSAITAAMWLVTSRKLLNYTFQKGLLTVFPMISNLNSSFVHHDKIPVQISTSGFMFCTSNFTMQLKNRKILCRTHGLCAVIFSYTQNVLHEFNYTRHIFLCLWTVCYFNWEYRSISNLTDTRKIIIMTIVCNN